MKIGLTGGSGFVGKYLIRDYSEKTDFVIPLINKEEERYVSNLKGNADICVSDYSVESLSKIFEGCDGVIHLAANVNHTGHGLAINESVLNIEEYIPNISITANVFEACKRVGISNIVCASSDAVWNKYMIKGDLKETTPMIPVNEYGLSKACGEMVAQFYNDKYDMQIKSFRMPEICGIDMITGMRNPFWKNILKASVEHKAIPIYGTGNASREMIYVKDVTRAFMMGVNRKGKGVYNIGTGKLYSNKEIAEAFCEVFSNISGIKLYPEKKEYGIDKAMNIQKARAELGFYPEFSLKGLVEDIKNEYEINKLDGML